ncbi:MAG: tyrosine-type recombinase/integrase, partial [Pirellulaceae bacterium]
MKKFPKPWFRPARGVWYVTLDGKQHNLGADRDKAFETYKRLLARPKTRRVESVSVAVLIDQFLEWVQKNRALDTYAWYRDKLQLFAERHPTLRVSELRKFHVTQWIDAYEVSSGTKRNLARSIVRCMNWAEDEGVIDQSPIRRFRKPKGGTRDTIITSEDFVSLLRATPVREFREMCRFAWYTGARAAECLAIERRHVEIANHRIVLPVSEEKMERAPRIIYMTDKAEAIVRRLCERWPSGKLFRNSRGKAWTTDAVNCAFQRIAKKTGRKHCLTEIRHSFCHRLLRSGVDALTVSVL